MTDLHIPRLDLARAVTDALGRGRYVLMTGGDGELREITLDLRERPDDLFGDINRSFLDDPACDTLVVPSDDHGPSVPAQGEHHRSAEIVGEENGWAVREPGPRVYEFALQDCAHWPHIGLEQVVWTDALDLTAADRADWVHVYDRVTRERRTLKRPEPDAVLTGLRDVAADLRGRPVAQAARGHGKSDAVRATVDSLDDVVGLGPWPDSVSRGDPVEPPFGCAALPPVGPLTSTEGLKPGDVLRHNHGWLGRVRKILEGDTVSYALLSDPNRGGGDDVKWFAFVGRPDADGWMTWAGGENPVPGATVEARYESGQESRWACVSDAIADYFGRCAYTDNIVAFRIVDTPPAV